MTEGAREIWFLTSELEGERASSFRQERWCSVCLDAGARIRIINLRGAFRFSDVQCESHDEFVEFRRRSLRLPSGPQASVREGVLVRVVRRLKHWTLVDLYLPNVLMALWHIHKALLTRRSKVVLMASSPPFSVAVIGAILRAIHGEKVVLAVDMRDAWALHRSLGGPKWIKRRIERSVLRRADRVSTVSRGLSTEFEGTYDVPTDVMYNVASHYFTTAGISPAIWDEISPEIERDRLKLVYTGSTPAGFYDLQSIVSAMSSLRKNDPRTADRIQLLFVGACDEARREAARQKVMKGDVVFVGHVRQAVARSIQAAADALVFIGYFAVDNGGVVSTKLFEYLCLGKPVLPLGVYKDSDVDFLLRRYCGRSVNVHTSEEILGAVSRVVAEGTDWLPKLSELGAIVELLDGYRQHAAKLFA
jgi:glycosyltransferase involved in cell wall biosynthesis